nr:class I SAM-dependent methyltransferase [Propionicimonas sp.]
MKDGTGDASDFDAATQDPQAWPQIAPVSYWEERYTGVDRVWSGKVNQVLADIAGPLVPGRALDLGCGEGADVIWLAQHGWQATGVDISPTAIGRATAAAEASGLDADRARFLATDLAAISVGAYDLVTVSFLHSPVGLPREAILCQAADRVAPGGHLLITSHADAPPWAEASHGHEHRFLGPLEELEQLQLDQQTWDVVLAEVRARQAIAPDGQPATLDDVVVLVRRR